MKNTGLVWRNTCLSLQCLRPSCRIIQTREANFNEKQILTKKRKKWLNYYNKVVKKLESKKVQFEMIPKAMLLQNHMINNTLNGFTLKQTQPFPPAHPVTLSSSSVIHLILNFLNKCSFPVKIVKCYHHIM